LSEPDYQKTFKGLEGDSITTDPKATPVQQKHRDVLVEALRAEADSIVDEWTTETSKVPYAKAGQEPLPMRHKSENLRDFFRAMVDRVEDPASAATRESTLRMARIAHLGGIDAGIILEGHLILREIMWRKVKHRLPEELKEPAMNEIDDTICKCVREFVDAHGALEQLQLWLTKGASMLPVQQASCEHALMMFCSSAMDYFGVDFVALFRHERDTNELVCESCCAKGVALTKGTRVLLATFSLADLAAKTRQTQVSPPPGSQSARRSKALGNLSFSRLIVSPATRGGIVYGFLLIGDTADARSFHPEEVRIADELAGMLGLLLENSENYQRLSLRSRAQKALIEIAASLQQEIESTETYRIIAEKLGELIPCNELMFYMFDWERRVGNPVFATGPYAAEIMDDTDFPANIGIVGAVARSRRAEIIMDVETDSRAAQIPDTPGVHARMLAVPVLGRKEVLGVIELLKYPPDIFSQEDLEIATMFANHAAVAIENSRLLDQATAMKNLAELHVDLLTHDIANYATPIAAYFSELRKREDLPPDVSGLVDRTVRHMECVVGLVDMTRTMAKLRETKPQPPRRVDVRDILEKAVAGVHGRVAAQGLEFEMDLPEGAVEVLADDLLQEFFSNLFFAAWMSVQHEPVKVVASARPKKEFEKTYWHVTISYPGRPVPEKLKADRLTMAKAQKSALAGGVGMGLVAVKSLVERYGGRAWISDIVPGDRAKGWALNMLFPKA